MVHEASKSTPSFAMPTTSHVIPVSPVIIDGIFESVCLSKSVLLLARISRKEDHCGTPTVFSCIHLIAA